MPVPVDAAVRELRDEVRKLGALRASVEAMVTVTSDARDAVIQLTHAIESLVTAVAVNTAAVRAATNER